MKRKSNKKIMEAIHKLNERHSFLNTENSWFWCLINDHSRFNISPVKGGNNTWNMRLTITLLVEEKFILDFINGQFGNVGTIYVGTDTCTLTFGKLEDLKALMGFFKGHSASLNEPTEQCVKLLSEALNYYTAKVKSTDSLPNIQKELQSLQVYKKGKFSHLNKTSE